VPEYADIYVLTSNRDAATIRMFLETMLPSGEEMADEYGVPAWPDPPQLTFKSVDELIEYCCQNPAEVHAIYWRSSDERKPEHAVVQFNSDGSLILGVSTDANDAQLADEFCARIMVLTGAAFGYVTHEDEPPESAEEFRSFVESLPLSGEPGVNEVRARRCLRQSWREG
jgi:hypothetical protein